MKNFLLLLTILLLASCADTPETGQLGNASDNLALDRSVLPIKEPVRPKYDLLDVRDATPPPRFEVTAPEGAPNVIVVLIDDMGIRLIY